MRRQLYFYRNILISNFLGTKNRRGKKSNVPLKLNIESKDCKLYSIWRKIYFKIHILIKNYSKLNMKYLWFNCKEFIFFKLCCYI